ncbi:arf-GAP domain and FG repeat-containing protein 1-like isoform X3 [Mercenaria mercenaria]|uniref:arf-GAP domain and FG repeat-containing protein 1-like isoform X3 n=1 Tax=Mercenaria mercenaria TaxID=6596 RepID=UPI00234F2A97|nr:arf-GAP domain and FG repeat-containing protein 1-like isoform X3 [Mercenaria mercenaria]
MASNKKKLDEKHLKMLREMVALAHNKQCFDCHQRGPTYINMTIGSYVCTACSGLLRGLNPPHRVKSISMASFTPDEMEFIKCHGNEYCRKVWLGLYDNRLGSQTEGRDEAKVKDFMSQKYERKRYYVAPSDSMKEEAKRMNESAITATKAPGTKPLKSLLGENAPKLQVGNTQEDDINITVNPFEDQPTSIEPEVTVSHADIFEEPSTSTPSLGSTGNSSILSFENTGNSTTPSLGNTGNSSTPSLGNTGNPLSDINTQIIQEQKAPVSATPPPIGSTPQSPGNQSIQSSKSSGSTAMDLLGDLGGDPFASSAPQTHPPGGGGFADFGNFGNTATSAQPQPFSQAAPLQPSGSSSQSSQQSLNGFMSTPAPSAPAPAGGGGGDKYSNLSDLFSAPTTTEESASTGWSSLSAGNTGVGWGGTTNTSGGINWGGESNSTTTGGVNWNSSSTQPVPSSSGLNWGGGSATTSSMSWGGAPATAQSNGLGAPGNPFLTASVANPFGGSSNTSLTSQSSMGVSHAPNANPFGGQPAVGQGGFGAFGAQNTAVSQNAGFGQFGTPASTAGAGFGQFGTPANSAGAGFGQFGTPASTGGGFGQFGAVQNGGFGANTSASGFGGAQTNVSAGFGAQQGFPAGQTGFGGQPQQQGGFGAMPGAGFGGQQGQGFPQQQAGFGGQPAQMQGFGGAPAGGGWGQMPASSATVNPFMSTAQQYSAAPKTGATNPFL